MAKQTVINSREYLVSLIPEKLPDWKNFWEEGFKIGQSIVPIVTPFCKAQGVKNEVEFRLRQASEGKMTWRIIMGLSSYEEQLSAMKALEKFNEETGLSIHVAHQVPAVLMGTPKENRANVPKALSYMLEEPEDWMEIATCSNIQIGFNDDHIGSPNAVYNTINALRAGNSFNGIITQFAWSFDGCPDDIHNLCENIKALGIMAAKYDDMAVTDSYMDDGIPAYFLDLASYLAYAKLEKYIVSDLCKSRYAFSYGHYETKIIPKMALWLAAHETFRLADQPGLSFIQANSIDHWDHHLHANYGFLVPEALMAILIERKYKTGVSWLSIPITEMVAVPTLQGILDMTGACQRAEEVADEYEEMIDFTEIERLRDRFIEFGNEMFDNIINGFEQAGVDITNPLEMLLVLKRMDPAKIEQFYHPSIVNGKNVKIKPVIPSTLWQRAFKIRDDIVTSITSPNLLDGIKAKRVLVASGDAHSFGAFVISSTLTELGAEVVDVGVSIEAIDVLDLADEHGITDVCISVHNGQALGYAKVLTSLAEERGKKYRIFMGGKLNGFLSSSDKEPVDVTTHVEALGIITSATVEELLSKLVE